jgi:hypothetical protein
MDSRLIPTIEEAKDGALGYGFLFLFFGIYHLEMNWGIPCTLNGLRRVILECMPDIFLLPQQHLHGLRVEIVDVFKYMDR